MSRSGPAARPALAAALLAAVLAVRPPLAAADVVHLVDGGRLEGEVERRGDHVRVTVDGGAVTVPLARVARIEESGAAPRTDLLDRVRAALATTDAKGCVALAAEARRARLPDEEGALLRRAAELWPHDAEVAAKLREFHVEREVLRPAAGAEAALRRAVGVDARIHRSRHWIMAHDVDDRLARRRAEMLERAWTKFHEVSHSLGLAPRRIPHALEALQFRDHAAWRASLPGQALDLDGLSGLYVHGTGRIHLFRNVTSPTIRAAAARADEARKNLETFRAQLAEHERKVADFAATTAEMRLDREQRADRESKLAEARATLEAERKRAAVREEEVRAFEKDVADYAAREDLSSTTHEACHQLAFATGVCRPGQTAWLIEGLATLFEVESEQTFVPEAPNRPRLRDLRTALDEGVPLDLRTVVTDRPFRPGAASKPVAYAQSWALVYFLYRTRRAELARYVRDAPPAGRGAEQEEAKLRAFRRFFGDDLDALGTEWRRFLDELRD